MDGFPGFQGPRSASLQVPSGLPGLMPGIEQGVGVWQLNRKSLHISGRHDGRQWSDFIDSACLYIELKALSK